MACNKSCTHKVGEGKNYATFWSSSQVVQQPGELSPLCQVSLCYQGHPHAHNLSTNLALDFKKMRLLYESGKNFKVKVLFPLNQGHIFMFFIGGQLAICLCAKYSMHSKRGQNSLMLTVMSRRNKNVASAYIIIDTLSLFIFKALLHGLIFYSFQWQDKTHPSLSWSSSAHFTEKYSFLGHNLPILI